MNSETDQDSLASPENDAAESETLSNVSASGEAQPAHIPIKPNGVVTATAASPLDADARIPIRTD